MPTTYTWPLLPDPVVPTSGGTGGSAAGAPVLPNPITAYTEQDLLDLFDRLLPEHYLAPLKAPGPGYELLQAYAAMAAALSLAVEHAGASSLILTSSGGAYATGQVQLLRASAHPEGLTVTVKAGTVVACSASGRQFATTADVTFGPSDVGPFTVGVEAVLQGYESNVPGQVLAADGTELPGEIDTVVTLVEDPPVGDVTIQVQQVGAATTGGVDAALDQHGIDRGLARLPGEADIDYKSRVRSLPDNISPDAVERALQQLCTQWGIAFEVIETWDVAYQTAYDGPSDTIAGSNYDPNLFAYDVDSTTPFRNRWMDESERRGCFIALVSNLQPIADVGMVYDDTAMNEAQLASPATGGSRAVCAYDVPADLGFGFRQGGFDGFDLPKQAIYSGLYGMLQGLKAAGVAAVVELRGQ